VQTGPGMAIVIYSRRADVSIRYYGHRSEYALISFRLHPRSAISGST